MAPISTNLLSQYVFLWCSGVDPPAMTTAWAWEVVGHRCVGGRLCACWFVWFVAFAELRHKLRMLLTTSGEIPGTETSSCGMVEGNVCHSKHIGRDFMAGLKGGTVGGELKGYTELLQEARKIATDRMIEAAKILGADAIVSVRYSTAFVMSGCTEIYVYGTAVKRT